MSDVREEAWRSTANGDVRTVAEDHFIASVFGLGPQKKERANLIAAAPDLLRAAEEAADELARLNAESGNSDDWPILNALRAAALKARGTA